MHSLTISLLYQMRKAAKAGSLPHPRDIRAAAVAYYRYFTAFITEITPTYDRLSKPADRLLDKWEAICTDYYAAQPADTPEKELQVACHTAFTELLNVLNNAPETPVKFKKYLAALDLDTAATVGEKNITTSPSEAGPPKEQPVKKISAPLNSKAPIAAKVALVPAVKKRAAKPIPPSNLIYRIRVGLEGAEDVIWRRVYLPATTELSDFHRLLQILFDWNDEQMHRFKVNYDYFGPANPDGMDQRELYDGINLESIYSTGTNKMRYTYDFADKWEHLVLIEKAVPREAGITYPLCTSGEGKAPLTGSGGTATYLDLVAALQDPHSPKHELARDILGHNWEPEYFSEAELNRLIRKRY